MQFKTASQTTLKCLSQGHNRMARVIFEPSPSRSQVQRSNHLTTLPTLNRDLNKLMF